MHKVISGPNGGFAARMQAPVQFATLDLRAHVDDARVRACAEDDQSQVADMDNEHALVHQERIRLPRGIRTCSAKVVNPSSLKASDPGDLTVVIELSI
jgi:hypothetical protein